ncbi:sulfatase-like hydrolase/transferase [Akkermansiaceae bacterium]|nr:sulfatase-like hydrolase/transferase [Akkermansiaceae bacterium]MDB4312920.1 sulfatase-like hydrolase/transferase [Akkermansiaceae bacterium]MDB4322774.1 sulfatase-like hydrolase/transferase [Akkermansiaceae bacterium]MDB4540815.1 sulfatase-like hydrolase/transferase [Akkermansiaceae bacterium]MDC1404606.1 sulfatase-like hydrolase/transferase [Akkermansiaceae bacterium]
MIFQKVTLLFCLAASWAQAASKPNIIFILTDDLGYGDYGVFFQNLRKDKNDRSEPWHITPELDEMAAEGIQLRHYYCAAPVCAPSRGSLLHGVHQGHANIRDNMFDQELEDNHTIATVLKGAGYSTAAIGKWGLQGGGKEEKAKHGEKAKKKGDPKMWPSYPTKRGFDFFHGYVRHRDGHMHYPKEDRKEVWENDEQIADGLDLCFTTDLFTARAKKWITDQKEAEPEKPFFLYLAYDTPHAILQLPPSEFPKEGLKWLGEKGKMINSAVGKKDSYTHPDYAKAKWDHDGDAATPEKSWPNVYQRYATNVRRIDDCVGDLLNLLKEMKIDDDTLVVFTTDNGPSKESYLPEGYRPDFFNSFGPFDGIKRDVYEGGVRAGALVRWPKSTPKGAVSDLPCQAHDWMATFANLAGVSAPARSDGTSLVPTLTGGEGQKEPLVYVEYLNSGKMPNYPEFEKKRQGKQRKQMQMIRFGDHIGVRYNVKNHKTPFEIYDITKDPKQLKNLAEKMPELHKKMSDQVLRMRRPHAKAKRPYDGELIPAISEVISDMDIKWQTFKNPEVWLAKLDDLEPVASGVAGDFMRVHPDKGDAILVSGFIYVRRDGAVKFRIPEGELSLLRIHDAVVIDSAYKPASNIVSGTIYLKKGRHPFRYYRMGIQKPIRLEF